MVLLSANRGEEELTAHPPLHLFPNGNGRHARLVADLLSENVLYKPPFTWGSANLVRSGDDRKKYIESLVAADRNEYKQLLEFVRS